MYALIRPLLFALDPETAHRVSLAALGLLGSMPGAIRPIPGRRVQCMGLDFHNRLGLAAGLDKDAHAVLGLARLGFGFVEVGTVTPRPQPGNPRPRLFRLPAQAALINRMGFNNAGVDAMVQQLVRVRADGRLGATRLGVNLGRNKDTPNERAVDDYLACLDAVAPYADYLTINLSSPNTPGLRLLQTGAALQDLLGPLKARQQHWQERLGTPLPLLLKIAPDLAEDDLDLIAETVLQLGVEGVIATNTTITRPGLKSEPLAQESGGLSGAPLRPLARHAVKAMAQRLGGRACVVGVGGIGSAADAVAMLESGADLLQIYTAFIYRGPRLIRELAGQ